MYLGDWLILIAVVLLTLLGVFSFTLFMQRTVSRSAASYSSDQELHAKLDEIIRLLNKLEKDK
ncbi:hypothetical protein B9K06_06680 [Bacillus sp. OG2]|nr:hypothetical protein B9K06_06680 [Bacillus sp. OG2]